MSSAFKGFETKEITLKSTGINPGAVVMLNEELLAVSPAEGTVFCGVCSAVRDGYASVIISGYAEAAFTGTAPVPGYQKLASDGNGGVIVDNENGREYLVVGVDSSASTVEFIVR